MWKEGIINTWRGGGGEGGLQGHFSPCCQPATLWWAAGSKSQGRGGGGGGGTVGEGGGGGSFLTLLSTSSTLVSSRTARPCRSPEAPAVHHSATWLQLLITSCTSFSPCLQGSNTGERAISQVQTSPCQPSFTRGSSSFLEDDSSCLLPPLLASHPVCKVQTQVSVPSVRYKHHHVSHLLPQEALTS